MPLVIALIPAALVYWIAVSTRSRAYTILMAIAMGALGLITGAASYAALDIGAVLVSVLFALVTVEFREMTDKERAEHAARRLEQDRIDSKTNDFITKAYLIVTVALVGGFFLYPKQFFAFFSHF